MSTIEWRSITEFPNYEISTEGIIRNQKTQKELKQNIRKQDGFAQVTLYNSKLGLRRTIKIHRIMAETFLNVNNQEQIIKHIDSNPINNNISNLTIEKSSNTLKTETYISNIDKQIEYYQQETQKLMDKRNLLKKEIPIKQYNITQEIWQNIDGFPEYEISTFGNVKSNKTNRILKPSIDSRGYIKCTLYHKTKGRCCFLIHRLVAQAFLEDWDESLTVDHIDHNPSNNNITNLQMMSFQQNVIRKKQNNFKPVNQYDLNDNFLQQFDSYVSAAETIKCSALGIKKCLNNTQLTSGGYKWKFADVD